MACFVQVAVRHNLSKAFSITTKLVGIKLFSKQHIRHLPRWAHRRPVRVNYGEDLNSDRVNYVEKLKIERESIQSITKDEDVLENSDMTCKDKETVTGITESVNTSVSKSATNVNYNAKRAEPESKLHRTWGRVSDETKVSALDETQKSSLQSKTKKVRKLEERLERKANKMKESAAKAGVPVYTKLQDNNPKLSDAMLIAKSKNKRKKRGLIVLEGKRLIKDAIDAGYIPQMVFFSRLKDAADLHLPDDGVQLYKISYKSISLWSDLTTSPGILGILKTPSVNNKKPGEDALPLTIICDNIRDPGNLGTVLRAAAGVGCQKVILTKGCVDLWEPKVLRSGAGAHFRTAIVSDVEWNELETHMDDEAGVFLADNSGQVSEDIQENEEDENVGNSNELLHEDEENTVKYVPEISESSELYKNRLSSIPILPYFAVDYVNQTSIILIIGGETEGLSINAFRLACNRCGIRLNVPLSNNVESLNSGTALGIILFEMKRQFLTKFQVKGRSENMEKIHLPNV